MAQHSSLLGRLGFVKTPGAPAPHRKHTSKCETETMPVPKTVTIVMSQHILDCFDGHSFFYHERPAGVPERVCGDLGIVNADSAKPLLNDTGDGSLKDPGVIPAPHQVDEQRRVHPEVICPHGHVILQGVHHLIRNGNHIVLVDAPLALDVQDVLSVQGIKVLDIDAGHLAGA